MAPAAVAAGIAALTAPLAAAALLALAAHLVHDRVLGGRLPRAVRLPAVLVIGAAAVAMAAAAAGNGPLAGIGGPVVGLGTTLAVVAIGVVLSWLAWTQHPELRPALTRAVLLLAVALVPEPPARPHCCSCCRSWPSCSRCSPSRSWRRCPTAATVVPAVPVTALAVAAVVGFLVVVNTTPAPPTGLAGWVSNEIDPKVVLRADPLDRAELSVNGIAVERLRDLAEPARPGELMVVTNRPATGDGDPDAPRCVAIATLAIVPRGAGGAPTAVCPAAPLVPETVVAEQVAQARFRAALPRNPTLDLQPEAAAVLQAGLVDPRLVLVLADLASRRRLAIDDFPVEPLEPPYALRRHVLLGAVDGLPASGGPQSLIRTWFAEPAEPVRAQLDRRARRGPAHRISGPHPDGADRGLTLEVPPCASSARPSSRYSWHLIGVGVPATALAAAPATGACLPPARAPVPRHAHRRRVRRLRGRPVAVVRRARCGLRGRVAVPAAAARQLRDQHAGGGRGRVVAGGDLGDGRRPLGSGLHRRGHRVVGRPGARRADRRPGHPACGQGQRQGDQRRAQRALGRRRAGERAGVGTGRRVRHRDRLRRLPARPVGPRRERGRHLDDRAAHAAGELDLHRAADRQGRRPRAAWSPATAPARAPCPPARSRPASAARRARTCCRLAAAAAAGAAARRPGQWLRSRRAARGR